MGDGKGTSRGRVIALAKTIKDQMGILSDLIDELESGDGSLEDAFRRYEEGMKLVKSCNEKIERIEKKILVLSGEEAGNGAGAEEQENELRF